MLLNISLFVYINIMRQDILDIFKSALAVVQPGNLLRHWIRREGDRIILGDRVFNRNHLRHLYVIATGKAAAAMGDMLEQILGDVISEGIIITKEGYGLPMEFMTVVETGHPVPDQNGVKAGEMVMQIVQHTNENDLVLVLLSGGSSSLVADIVPGVSLEELQHLTSLMLKSGAEIREINTVRKHLSSLKGGQLARLAYPATVVCLALSDVIDDPQEVIASGPTVPDPTTFGDALEILDKYQILELISPAIRERLIKGQQGELPETPKPGDNIFERNQFNVIGNNKMALLAAAEAAKEKGYNVFIEDVSMHGESKERAVQLAIQLDQYRGPRPACILLGGETTVTVKGNGRGGRNQEFALAILAYWKASGKNPLHVPVILSAATDGTDGPTDAAGALVDGKVLQWVYDQHEDPQRYLDVNDSYGFFNKTDAQLFTGPTYTNVMDMVIVLIH
jgi:hydroxypyruvate reductase